MSLSPSQPRDLCLDGDRVGDMIESSHATASVSFLPSFFLLLLLRRRKTAQVYV